MSDFIDPVCLIHGKKKSEHECLYCCLCYKPLTREECNVLPSGMLEDVCKVCAQREQELMASQAEARILEQPPYPKYMRLCGKERGQHGCAVCLSDKATGSYWRPAGNWYVTAVWVPDGIQHWQAQGEGPMAHVTGLYMEECTEEYYKKDNGSYA